MIKFRPQGLPRVTGALLGAASLSIVGCAPPPVLLAYVITAPITVPIAAALKELDRKGGKNGLSIEAPKAENVELYRSHCRVATQFEPRTVHLLNGETIVNCIGDRYAYFDSNGKLLRYRTHAQIENDIDSRECINPGIPDNNAKQVECMQALSHVLAQESIPAITQKYEDRSLENPVVGTFDDFRSRCRTALGTDPRVLRIDAHEVIASCIKGRFVHFGSDGRMKRYLTGADIPAVLEGRTCSNPGISSGDTHYIPNRVDCLAAFDYIWPRD